MTDAAITELTPLVGRRAACRATGRSQASWYRQHRASAPPSRTAPPAERRPQPRALSAAERARVLDVLHEERFVDEAPATVYARLLDEGVYLCSEATMYRNLRAAGEVRERRRQAVHPPKIKPELLASSPNEVWSWDITKLRGPARRVFYHLYSVIDIYSRYTVGWMVADREDARLAERLLADSITKQGITRDRLTIHADRGSSMASRSVAELLADLGVTKTHSRPRCSNDPFSEAQYKTLKYRPDFPDRFGSIAHARDHCHQFFTWYNTDHRHSGIGYHTPADVHHGHHPTVRAARAQVLSAAHTRTPERFVRKPPEPPALPTTVWINKPHTRTPTPLTQRIPDQPASKTLTGSARSLLRPLRT
jgi:putative transposase